MPAQQQNARVILNKLIKLNYYQSKNHYQKYVTHSSSPLLFAELNPTKRFCPTNHQYRNTSNAIRSTGRIITRRSFSFTSIPKFFVKAVRLPATIGGGLAAGGSYVAYKVEQASSYTQDQISTAKDFANGVLDKTSEFFKQFGIGGGSNSGDGGSNGGGGDGGDTATAVGATAAAVGLSAEETTDDEELLEDDEDDEEEEDNTDNEMLNLTRQMIDIRNILLNVDHSDTLKLPSIVVIGSQSSGKSSVLEAIVGQEFLPKGSNMVTRRPIELTLINAPEGAADVAEFPALKMNNLTDFQQVQQILFDLNMAVPLDEAISNDPVQLIIRSPRVPDLSLVDLPGYIQVEAADQPIELKRKIKMLCDRYLEAPNIILAISAADVDLANSAALRASRVADPRGERTIGVVTKLDLVPAERAREILTNKKYPLKMGYVGVITKAPAKSIFRRNTGFQAFVAQQNFELSYLKENRSDFSGTTVGTKNLKKKLMKVLEKSMALSLKPTHYAIQQELEETSYKFKVEFNDRQLTPEMYLANNIDALKVAVKEFSEKFSRNELRSLLKNELDQKVLDLMAERYWNKPFELKKQFNVEPDLSELPLAPDDDLYWHKKLDLATSSLTKLGVGRISTQLVTNTLLTEIGNLVDNTSLRNHPKAKEAVQEAATTVLSARFYSTADQVENCIKPYKYEIELEDREWNISREHSLRLVKEEVKQCEESFNLLKKSIGGRKLSQVITYLEKKNEGTLSDTSNESLGFSPTLIERGREAIFLRDRASLLKMRSYSLKSSTCKFKENKYKCPEIFLDAVVTKLTSTAILFLNVELLSDFYYNFPRELDTRFFSNLTKDEIEFFAKEDPKIKSHIELQQRKELLELALSKIESVLAIQRNKITNMNKEPFNKWR